MVFKASNGITVWESDGTDFVEYVRSHHSQRVDDAKLAIREFYLHERDEELGRWRWPENPDYVVYAVGPNLVVQIDETTGTAEEYARWEAELLPGGTAHAYFEAHPEPKPWDEAKVGEIWALTVDGGEVATTFRPGIAIRMDGARVELEKVTAGRRIWPESD